MPAGDLGDDFIAFGDVEEDPAAEEWSVAEDRTGLKLGKYAVQREPLPKLSKKVRDDLNQKRAPWCDDAHLEQYDNISDALHNEVMAFTRYIQPSAKEHTVRSLIIQTIRNVITRRWPRAQVHAFGSYKTKLYTPVGDIDLVVIDPVPENTRSFLYRLATLLRQFNIAESCQVIASAKVPIVKFTSMVGRFSVDISYNRGNGIVASKLICDHLDRFSTDDVVEGGDQVGFGPIRSLVMLIKAFLSQRGQSEVFSGGLGSYSVICLVISFLQLHPKVQTGEILPSQNLGVLLLEYLELYGKHFNYDQTGVSIREQGSYFRKVDRGWYNPARPFLLSIEDPLDAENDVSKSSYKILDVRSCFAGGFEELAQEMYARQELLDRRRDLRQEQVWSNDDHVEDALEQVEEKLSKSILASIVGMPKSTLQFRQRVNEIYDSGQLQKACGLAKDVILDYHDTNEVEYHESRPDRYRYVALSDDEDEIPGLSRNGHADTGKPTSLESRLGGSEASKGAGPVRRKRTKSKDQAQTKADDVSSKTSKKKKKIKLT